MARSLEAQVKSFVTSTATNGQRGLALVRDCVSHGFAHNDFTPLAWLLAKTDQRDAAILRKIAGKVTEGLKLDSTSTKAKQQPSGLYIQVKDGAGMSEAFAILETLVDNQTSFRSAAVTEALFEKVEKEFDEAKWIASVFKKMDKEGISLPHMIAMLNAQSKVNSEDKIAA